jgi:hypothetical protein
MSVEILHSGFDGLKFTLQAEISPALRHELMEAKAYAKASNGEAEVKIGGLVLPVRAGGGSCFVTHTGDHGAIWMFQDPEHRIPNNPGITVDFRAFGLATGGLTGAEAHFRRVMAALAIPYADHQLRVTRADFAVDLLAPWFEPDRMALVVPPGTKITEYAGNDETATQATGGRVTGLRAGAIANRQLAIYDKRAEVIQQRKMGWLMIWNAERARRDLPPLDLADREASQVWRFEMRLGSKQLRNRFEMQSWEDVHTVIGDAFNDALGRIRYCAPTSDRNRSRWPVHGLWQRFGEVIASDLHQNCCGVLPSDVAEANRTAKMRELDRQLLGLFITRAALSDVTESEMFEFMENHIGALQRQCDDHPKTLEERLAKAAGRYRWV